MLNSFKYSLPQDLESALRNQREDWKNNKKIARIWNKDASVWTETGEENWLGWLDVIEKELGEPEKYSAIKSEAEEFEYLVLLGMGGSSLCPEVLSKTFGKTHFHILDSTDPQQIKTLTAKIEVEKTLFFVSSKSG
ncbi:MAG: transaldolase, partial [Pyrinomonadaceae bacterium]